MAVGVIYVPEIEDAYLAKSSETASRVIPPLGAEWVRHVVECTHPEHRIRILVGGDRPVRDLDELLTPEDRFFAVSCTSLSYRPALPLIAQAEARGIPTFLGGAHARVMARSIHRRHPKVMVVTGPGEGVIADFLNGIPPPEIPGVFGGAPEGKRSGAAPYEFYPFLHETTDYSFFSRWGRSGSELYRDRESTMRVGVRGITGCSKRKACSFCSTPRVQPYDTETRAEYLVEERKSIVRRFGEQTYILDCSDSLPSQECLAAMGRRLDSRFGSRVHCGAMVWEILDDRWRDLAVRAGYTDFLIGLEGFARRHLPLAYKPDDSIEMLFALLRSTQDTNLHFLVSGIVGWPGECEESLSETAETIRRLLEFDHVVCISVNCLLPLPGSAIFHGLVKRGIFHADDDCPDLRAGFLAHMAQECPEISADRLRTFVHETMATDRRVVQVLGFIDEPGPLASGDVS